MCHRRGTHGDHRHEGRTFDNEVELGACSTIGFIGNSEALLTKLVDKRCVQGHFTPKWALVMIFV